jgi:hypothetical protein
MKKPKKRNQFGKRMAHAIPVWIQAWLCSKCRSLCYGEDGEPPIRCSNRENCGKLFH